MESYLPQYGPAAGATASSLVSNTGQVGFLAQTSNDYSQAFTTGPATVPGGEWAITSLQIGVGFQNPNPTTLPIFTVSIWTGTAGTQVGTFSLSSALVPGLNTFTADGVNPVVLDPNTRYLLFVDVTTPSSGSGADVRILITLSNAEDAGGATSWSIGDTLNVRPFASTGAFNTSTDSLKLALTGYAEIPPAQRTLSQWGDNYAQSTYECGGKPNPKIEAFYKDPLGFNWNSGETLYCDLSTGKWVPGRNPQAGVDYARDDQLIAPGASGYNDSCYFTDAEGNRTTLAKSVTNPDGSWARRSDGSRIFIIIQGAHWDPIAQRCVQRSS